MVTQKDCIRIGTETVGKDDVVILCGDISWALKPDEALADLAWIHALPGRKLFFKGNHDLWWTSVNKLNRLYEDGTMRFLQCDAQILEIPTEGVSACQTEPCAAVRPDRLQTGTEHYAARHRKSGAARGEAARHLRQSGMDLSGNGWIHRA